MVSGTASGLRRTLSRALSTRTPRAGDMSNVSSAKLFRPLMINCGSAPWFADSREWGSHGGDSTQLSAVTRHSNRSAVTAVAKAVKAQKISDVLVNMACPWSGCSPFPGVIVSNEVRQFGRGARLKQFAIITNVVGRASWQRSAACERSTKTTRLLLTCRRIDPDRLVCRHLPLPVILYV